MSRPYRRRKGILCQYIRDGQLRCLDGGVSAGFCYYLQTGHYEIAMTGGKEIQQILGLLRLQLSIRNTPWKALQVLISHDDNML